MLYDCKTNNQSQKRCTMDSFKEKDKLALKPSKRPRIEVDEEMVRRIIAGLAPLDSPVVRRIPEPKEEDTDASEENTSETPSEAPVSTAEKTDVDTQTTTVKEPAGFRRKKFCCPISNRPSSHRWIAVTALRSMSAPKPSTKYRKYSTCWETIIQD